METFKFNYYLLYHLGINLSSNSTSFTKIKSFSTNLFVFLYLIFFTLIPTISFIKHSNDIGEILITNLQFSIFGFTCMTYICFTFHKFSVNRVFCEISDVVCRRIRLRNNREFYEKIIKKIDSNQKYVTEIYLGIYYFNNILLSLGNLVSDFMIGEMKPETWYLPFNFR